MKQFCFITFCFGFFSLFSCFSYLFNFSFVISMSFHFHVTINSDHIVVAPNMKRSNKEWLSLNNPICLIICHLQQKKKYYISAFWTSTFLINNIPFYHGFSHVLHSLFWFSFRIHCHETAVIVFKLLSRYLLNNANLGTRSDLWSMSQDMLKKKKITNIS